MRKSSEVLTWMLFALLGIFPAVSCRRSGSASQGILEDRKIEAQIATLTRQEQILSSELALAKNPAPYLTIDFLAGKIELRAQGRCLRSFPIRKIDRSGGAPSAAQTWDETEARPLQRPERAKMIPGSGEETTSSIAAQNPWGPKMMPIDYDLICKEDRFIAVRSLPSEESHSRFARIFMTGFRQSLEWARSLVGRRRSAYRETLEIWLTEDQAQLLFWSLPKQFGILILNAS